MGPALTFTLGQEANGAKGAKGLPHLQHALAADRRHRALHCAAQLWALLTSRHNQRPPFPRPYFVRVFFPCGQPVFTVVS